MTTTRISHGSAPRGSNRSRDILRTVHFRPYRQGMGPTFTLVMRDSNEVDSRGVARIAYRLTMRAPDAKRATVVFEAADYCGSPMHADDSNDNVVGLMGFLTLRPGDTDAEYFESYTDAQREFADQWAETLSSEVDCRFCCPECGSCLDSDGACSSHGKQRPRPETSAVHSHTETGFCPVCITPGGGCSFAG